MIVIVIDVEAIPSDAVKVIKCVPTSVIIGDTVNKLPSLSIDIVTVGDA